MRLVDEFRSHDQHVRSQQRFYFSQHEQTLLAHGRSDARRARSGSGMRFPPPRSALGLRAWRAAYSARISAVAPLSSGGAVWRFPRSPARAWPSTLEGEAWVEIGECTLSFIDAPDQQKAPAHQVPSVRGVRPIAMSLEAHRLGSACHRKSRRSVAMTRYCTEPRNGIHRPLSTLFDTSIRKWP